MSLNINYGKKNLLGYDKFTFFWNGPFSNWHSSPFVFLGTKFATAEQFMMFGKAMFFNDLAAATQIMESTNPKENKKVGRSVKGFNPATWNQVAKDIVYAGCWAKFAADPILLDTLLKTEGTLLVEASPVDPIWGIGLAENHKDAGDPLKWRGTNWLGEVLTKLRDDLLVNKPAEIPSFINDWFKMNE